MTSSVRPAARPGQARARLLAVALAASVALLPVAQPASAATPKEKKLSKLVNEYRAKKGKPKLKVTKKMTRLAHKHSRAMADAGSMFHSTTKQMISYANKANCDVSIGENVGYNPGTVGDMHQAFIDSKPHRKQMLRSYWEKMGVGIVVDATGMMWVTELFCY